MTNLKVFTGEITGVLFGAEFVGAKGGPRSLTGYVNDDAKGRFSDGKRIVTSTIMEEFAGDIFRTRNSVYRVASWAQHANDNHTDLRAANRARQAEWDPGDQLTLAYRGNELAGEVGEACNVIKKLERERLGIAGSRDTIEHLAEELADVVICADLIAMAAGIDLDAAVREKFNATSKKVGLRTRLVAA